jgi:hypothetical protein
VNKLITDFLEGYSASAGYVRTFPSITESPLSFILKDEKMKKIAVIILILLFFGTFAGQAQPVQAIPTFPTQYLGLSWGGNLDDSAGNIAIDGAGNMYVAGQFTGTVDFDPNPLSSDIHTSNANSIDASLSKFDPSGKFLWARTWGGTARDVAYGVGLDADGSAYVTGPYRKTVDFNPDPALVDSHTSNADTENNVYLSKFSPDGSFQWVRTWGPALIAGSFGAEGYTVAVAGNYLYVAGDFSGNQTDFNPWGSHDWHTNHPPASGPIFFDAFLSKFDLNGNFQWARTWGGEGYDDGPGVAVDGLGNVYVAGMYASTTINFDPAGGVGGTGHPAHDSGISVDVFLSKFDASGNFLWVRTWGSQGTEDAMGSVAIDGNNNVYVAGRFGSTNCDFNPGGTPDLHSTQGDLDPFVSKFAPDGTFQWARTWGGSGSDSAAGLDVTADGTVYLAGWYSGTVDFDPGSGTVSRTSNGKKDAFLSRLSSAGDFIWVGTWGGQGDEIASVSLDAAGKIYAGGGFTGTADLDPGSGADWHTSSGYSAQNVTNYTDAFLIKFYFPTDRLYLPAALR